MLASHLFASSHSESLESHSSCCIACMARRGCRLGPTVLPMSSIAADGETSESSFNPRPHDCTPGEAVADSNTIINATCRWHAVGPASAHLLLRDRDSNGTHCDGMARPAKASGCQAMLPCDRCTLWLLIRCDVAGQHQFSWGVEWEGGRTVSDRITATQRCLRCCW